jgi:hypothetical protein
MEKLAEYTMPSQTNTIEFTGLDTAHNYRNILVFYKLRHASTSQLSFFVCPNYNGVTTWGGGTTVAWTSGGDVNYQSSSVNGLEVHGSMPGTNDIGSGYGLIFLSGRGAGERANIMVRHAMTGVFYNNIYGPSTGLSASQGPVNTSLITSLRFHRPNANFSIAQFHIYGV